MEVLEHVTVYREKGRYAGWPANYGIWSWGDEIVVGFVVGYLKYDGASFHPRDRERPMVTMQARSVDGGRSWQVGRMPCRTPGGRALSADEHVVPELGIGGIIDDELMEPPGGIDFTHPDFALMCARSGLAAGAKSWFYLSYDRCRSWRGPYKLPDFGLPGIAARTDYLVLGRERCLLFLTAAKSDGNEGRVFCIQTRDGGRTFEFLSWIGPEPEGFAIMPASVRLPDSKMLVAVRCRGREGNWIDLYASDDEGKSWRYVTRPVENTGRGGNPPTLTLLQDGRLCITYGYRNPPFRICAKLSEDGGESWGEELILREGAGDGDIGYPRTVQLPDGTIVTVYYWNDRPDGERYIAATLWRP
ncbi:exo-alpha-sialidase [Candidatus Poribacteria bacterium]|nr:MAG: exo-alpha-sialidase [Candidatus Poribacteria bacterium]